MGALSQIPIPPESLKGLSHKKISLKIGPRLNCKGRELDIVTKNCGRVYPGIELRYPKNIVRSIEPDQKYSGPLS